MPDAPLSDLNQTEPSGPLQDNVVLLVGGARNGGRSLAVSLAKRGADIVVVYASDQELQVQKIKRLVQEQGRRCLTIQVGLEDKSLSRHVVSRVIETLGRLDLFIDYAALPGSNADLHNDARDCRGGTLFSNFELMVAALREMVDGEQTTTSNMN